MSQVPLESKYALEVYPRRGINIVRGEGARLWSDDDRVFIDCAAGVGWPT